VRRDDLSAWERIKSYMAHGDYALFFTACDLESGIFLRLKREKKEARKQEKFDANDHGLNKTEYFVV